MLAKRSRLVPTTLVLALLSLLSWQVWAASQERIGDTALCESHLTPSDFGTVTGHLATVAREFRITRHNNRGMVNITVLRKLLGSPGQPVHAFVDVTGTSQAGRSWQIPVREVREGKAIYYIGEFGISNGETIDFDVRVRPQGTPDTLQLEFSQTFHAG